MKRIFHHYLQWEEFHAGMWNDVDSTMRQELLEKAIVFTGDATLYGSWMLRVLDVWPRSCEHNLTDTGQNRKAWIGHAATCLAIQCPEHITRKAWGFLSREQQDQANAAAENAIKEWEQRHARQNQELRKNLGAQGILGWRTRRSASALGAGKQGAVLSSHCAGHNAQRQTFSQPWLIAP